MTLSEAHVRSGQVMTVARPDPVGRPRRTLMHEHILNDCRCWWNPPTDARAPVPRRQPRLHRDPLRAPAGPVRQPPQYRARRRAAGDRGARGLRRRRRPHRRRPDLPRHRPRPGGPARASPARPASTSSWAPATTSSPRTRRRSPRLSADDIADEIVAEATDGVDGTGVRIGLIGEIGVSSDFTPDEEKSLRGAARAQARTGLPLMVHLPGWFRLGHEVLDIVEEDGADLRHTVLCHMNPAARRLRLPGDARRAAAPSSNST